PSWAGLTDCDGPVTIGLWPSPPPGVDGARRALEHDPRVPAGLLPGVRRRLVAASASQGPGVVPPGAAIQVERHGVGTTLEVLIVDLEVVAVDVALRVAHRRSVHQLRGRRRIGLDGAGLGRWAPASDGIAGADLEPIGGAR